MTSNDTINMKLTSILIKSKCFTFMLLAIMNRRHYLVATGGIASALWGGATMADNHEKDTTPNDAPGETELQFGDRQMVVDHGGFSPRAFAVVEIENVGTVSSGQVSISVGWLDEGESKIGDDRSRLPSLGPDETWLAHVRTIVDPEEIADFEVTGEFQTGHPRAPHGLSVAESDHHVDNGEITGRVENTREEDIERLEAQGKIYGSDGTVLGGGRDWERDLPSGRDWTFDIRLPRLPEVVADSQDYEAPEPTDHTVLLDARTHPVVDPPR